MSLAAFSAALPQRPPAEMPAMKNRNAADHAASLFAAYLHSNTDRSVAAPFDANGLVGAMPLAGFEHSTIATTPAAEIAARGVAQDGAPRFGATESQVGSVARPASTSTSMHAHPGVRAVRHAASAAQARGNAIHAAPPRKQALELTRPPVRSAASAPTRPLSERVHTGAVHVAVQATEFGLHVCARVGRMNEAERERLRHAVTSLLAQHGMRAAGVDVHGSGRFDHG